MTRLLVLTLLLAASPVAAQEVTGRLEGRVQAPGGRLLSGVEVTASSPSMLGIRTLLTGHDGRFRFTALPVGSYRLELRRVGFRPLIVESVHVRLGVTASLPRLVLDPQAAVELAALVVTAEAAGLDPSSTAGVTSLDISSLDALPLERNFREIMLLAPQAVPSFIGDGVNVAGATGFENNYYVDGINITSPINGGTSMDLPYNFVQQIDIRNGGATAEDAQALGAVVNVVTPSGGNEFRGSAFGFWSGDGVQTAARPVSGGTQTGFAFYDAGIALSGPVLRDRLWFFAAYNRNYEQLDHTYSFGTLADVRRQDLFAAKLSWRVGPQTSAIFTVLGDPSQLEPVSQPLFTSGLAQNREVLELTGRAGGVGVSLQAHHILGPTALFDVALSQMTRIETAEAPTTAGHAPYLDDRLVGTLAGGRGVGSDFDARRRTIRANVTWQPARHSVKAGVVYEELRHAMVFCWGRSTCGGDIIRADTALYNWHWANVGEGTAVLRNPAVYAQDAWQATSRLLVSAGVRWSRQDMVNAHADTITFRIPDGLQPRVRVTYQFGAASAQQVFASWGRIADQIALWSAQEFGAGAESLMTFPQDPRADTTGGTLGYAVTYGAAGSAADPDLRGQTSDEWSVGYRRRLRMSLGLTVRALRRSIRDAVANGADTTFAFVWGNPGRGWLSQFPRTQRTYDAIEVTLERAEPGTTWYQLSYVLSRTHGNFPGIYLSDWMIPATSESGPAYVFASQWDNSTGLLPNDRTHVFKAHGGHQYRFGLTVGASLLIASGTPRTEYGAVAAGPPFFGFASPRGGAGRTPTIWDLGIRAAYAIPLERSAIAPRVLLDLQHVGSPRAAVSYDQQHYTCLDASGNQSCPNAGYGRVTQYQPPMTARVGLVVAF